MNHAYTGATTTLPTFAQQMFHNASGRLTDFLIYYFFNGMKIHKAQKKSIQFVFCLKNEINTPVKGFDATADQTGGAETNRGGCVTEQLQRKQPVNRARLLASAWRVATRRSGRFIFSRLPLSDGPIKPRTDCQACQAEE